MRENVLFEVTKDSLETGLRGVPVGYCVTSYVDPEKGLFYAGIPIEELAMKPPVELIYLLYFGKLGKKTEIEIFTSDLKKRAALKKQTVEAIEALPKEGHSIDHFAAAILIAGMFETKGDWKEDCLDVIAKMPQIAALVINASLGWGKTKEPDPSLEYIEGFVQMLNIPEKKTKNLLEVMRLFYALHLDHAGGNLSAFVGKAVASGLEHMYGSLAASVCALAGPRHGRANQDSLEFIEGIFKKLGESPNPGQIEALIRKKRENQEVIYGFGHAVLRVEDPRASIFYEYAQKHFPDHPLVRIALFLRTEGSKVLKEDPKIASPYPNIDAISGSLLSAAGFAYPECYTVLFGLARACGIAIQILYERTEARGGKGTPIVRPKYLYKPRV